jgi:hypothetical protein
MLKLRGGAGSKLGQVHTSRHPGIVHRCHIASSKLDVADGRLESFIHAALPRRGV